MPRFYYVVLVCVGVSLGACTTAYGPHTITGGYSDREIAPDRWIVVFSGNAYTTAETVQTFWLYRAANLTLEQGYDAFEILSPMNLAAWQGQQRAVALVQVAYIRDPDKPILSGTIRLLKKPFAATPPKTFDAQRLKDTLEPLVQKLCSGNVCPHFHGYLLPSTASNSLLRRT